MSAPAPTEGLAWWQAALQRSWEVVRDEARSLVRVSRIDQPEAILLAPEQTFFLRENLKFKLLNARLGILARQFESARSDLAAATAALNKYFDPASRRTQNVASTLQQAQAIMKAAESNRLKGILMVTDEELVSSDFNHNPASSTVDLSQTQVIDGGLIRVLSWYDNEWGFSNRMADTAAAMAKLI